MQEPKQHKHGGDPDDGPRRKLDLGDGAVVLVMHR
jgi:hypothetical protein